MTKPTVKFIKSGASVSDFIQDSLPKLILTGRSNVGKSSLINCMTGLKSIARVSATPGKTAYVNYFLIGDTSYWVDLPGYGYAKVSQGEKERWGRLMEEFFANLDKTARGLLIVDIRHKPTQDDVGMATLYRSMDIPFIVVANKLDKIKRSQMEPQLDQIRETLSLDRDTVLIPFSAEKGDGKQILAPLMGL